MHAEARGLVPVGRAFEGRVHTRPPLTGSPQWAQMLAMSVYQASVPHFTKMLGNLSRWLDEAATHAENKGYDPAVLLTARLAPDQYTLLRQIQAACDAAKAPAARLAGQTPPSHPDTEQTWDEARARVKTVLDYLQTVEPSHFEGAEDRIIALPFMPGKGMKGTNYLHEMALPNFYFHIDMAYAILRHNGVALGKTPYIGSLTLIDL